MQSKQGWEKTLRKIQGKNPVEKTRTRENLKENLGRQPCKENKDERKS
jgi:hypothetical protein